MHLVWKTCGSDSKWVQYTCPMSTLPGVGPNHMAQLRSVFHPGQYKNAYCMGTHSSNRPCLKHCGHVRQDFLRRCSSYKARSDVNCDSGSGYAITNAAQDKYYSLNIHGKKGYWKKEKWISGEWGTNVNALSHGCQVIADSRIEKEVLPIVYASLRKHGEKANIPGSCADQGDVEKCTTYTLINDPGSMDEGAPCGVDTGMSTEPGYCSRKDASNCHAIGAKAEGCSISDASLKCCEGLAPKSAAQAINTP